MNQLPTKEQIRQWITDNPGLSAKRDIAKAFGIKGAARIELKRILKELEEDGAVAKKKRAYRDPDSLPPVSILSVLPPDDAGDLYLRPLEWQGEGEPPRILFIPKKGDPALGAGDRVLARLAEVNLDDYRYEARLIRQLGTNAIKVLGIFRKGSDVPGIIDEILEVGKPAVWVQLGIYNEEAARYGESKGLKVVMDRCIKIEHARFVGRMHWLGFNTQRVTSLRGGLQ